MSHPVLSVHRNSNFRAVREAQTLLNDRGHRAPIDGHFSLATRNAVRAFQEANGIEVTGVVDGETWVELHGATPVEVPDHGGAGLRHDHIDDDGTEQTPAKKPTVGRRRK